MNSQSSHEPSGGVGRGRREGQRSEAKSPRQADPSALWESEQRYRTLFGAMAEGFALHEILCDADGRPCDYRFLDVNPAFERQIGLKSADLVGRTVREVLPGIEPIWIERYGRVALTGQPEQFEAWSGALDRWYEVRAYQAAPGRFAALFTDITERKRSEQAAHSAALFPTQNPLPVLRVARSGILLYANPSSARLLESWACRGGQRVPEEICRCVTETLDAHETAEIEVACDGVLYSFSVTPVVSEDYANLYGRDVTESKRAEKALHEVHERLQRQARELQTANEELHAQAEELAAQAEELQASNDELREQELALRESEKRLKRSQEIAHLGSWELDLGHNRLTWSDEVYRIFGLQPQEFGATYEAFLEHVHPEDRAAVDAAYGDSLRDNRDAYEIEHRVIRRPSGEIRIVHEKCQHFRDASGRIVRSIGMVHDITQRKQMEADLRRLNDQLEEEVQAQTEELKDTIDRLEKEMTRRVLAEGDLRERSQMLEQRAHQLQKLTLELSQAEDRERKRLAEILHDDLQQQLAAAKFHLSLLSRRIPQDPATQRTVDQLDQILKDAVEKSRSLSHELSPAVLYQNDLGESFEWLARQLKAKHGLAVYVESRGRINPSSEPLKIFLYKAAQEILFNVVKHSRVKEARLRVQRMHSRVWLTISDQGQGFDPRSLGKTGGFGLLSIRERIELLGGRMKIRSAPGRGSTFLIAMPDGEEGEKVRRKEGKKGRTDEGNAFLRSEVPASLPSDLPGDRCLRVLLVDDHKVVREGLASLLKGQPDLEVVGQAGDGREAVDLAYQLGPDVVVMDAAMPLMAGDEATRQIKLHLPNVRIVALSMFEESDMAEAMRRAGAEAYLLKTAPSDELLAAIRGPRV